MEVTFATVEDAPEEAERSSKRSPLQTQVAEPLSAVVTVGDDGSIRVTGSKTQWRYGVSPKDHAPGIMPWISDGYYA